MSVQVTPHPRWVADLDAALDPSREAILDTAVIVHASENQLRDGKIQNFLVAFYPIIRDFPQWLPLLLDRSPADGKAFFRDNIRVEKRPDAMSRDMDDDEHPIHALEIIKNCVKRGETPHTVTDAALKSLGLMKGAMVASYDS